MTHNMNSKSCDFYSINVKQHEITVQFHGDWLHDQKEFIEAFAMAFELSEGLDRFGVVLDFESVDNLSSVAIGELFRFEKVIKKRGGTLSIVNCKPPIVSTLRVVQIDRKCDIQSLENTMNGEMEAMANLE